MKIEPDTLGEELRALLKSPQLGVQEYAADPHAVFRVGKMLSEAVSTVSPQLYQGEFL
jgi:phage portal protein BeeE